MVRAYEAIVFVASALRPEDFHVVLWGRLTQWEAKLICVTNDPCRRKQMWPLSGLELRFGLQTARRTLVSPSRGRIFDSDCRYGFFFNTCSKLCNKE